jgi:hypothetical protein
MLISSGNTLTDIPEIIVTLGTPEAVRLTQN